jgi:hypothetical protein
VVWAKQEQQKEQQKYEAGLLVSASAAKTKGGKKGRSKICTKDGYGALIDESK